MFSRSVIRILNKDNDKIIGRIVKRNYYVPDFKEQNFNQPFKEIIIKEQDEVFTKLNLIDQKIEHLINMQKQFDVKINKLVKNMNKNKYD